MLALQIQDCHKVYGNGHVALKGIQLDITDGDFFALLGPNGAGKTTMIGIITSLVRKTSGKVSIFGHDIDDELLLAKSQIGIVPQEFNFSIFEKVEDILLNQAGYYGIAKAEAKKRAETLLKRLELWDKRRQISRNLSGGMKRRLMIARALMHKPKLLILDEPTAGVDIEIRRSMWEFLREINEQGTTILLTTHYLEEAEQLCNNVAIIQDGTIIENTSVQSLISRLQVETFILDIQESLSVEPSLEGYACVMQSPNQLVVDVSAEQDINTLMRLLSEQNITVTSLRNKASRLEELFLRLVTHE